MSAARACSLLCVWPAASPTSPRVVSWLSISRELSPRDQLSLAPQPRPRPLQRDPNLSPGGTYLGCAAPVLGADGGSLYVFVHPLEFSLLLTSQSLVPQSCLVTDSHIKLPPRDLLCGFSLTTGPGLRRCSPAACGDHMRGPERIVSGTRDDIGLRQRANMMPA